MRKDGALLRGLVIYCYIAAHARTVGRVITAPRMMLCTYNSSSWEGEMGRLAVPDHP